VGAKGRGRRNKTPVTLETLALLQEMYFKSFQLSSLPVEVFTAQYIHFIASLNMVHLSSPSGGTCLVSAECGC